MEPVNLIGPNDKSTEKGAPAAVQVVSGKLQDATVTQVDEEHDHGDILDISESDEKSLNRARAKPTSWMLRWCDTILRREPRAPPEPITSREEPPQPKAPVTPISSKPQTITTRDSFGPRLYPRERGSGKVRQKSPNVKSMSVTDGAGHKNLAELYARYEKVKKEGRDAYHEYESNEATTDGSDVSASDQALEEMQKFQCRFCSLYYSPEQNLRDIDDGRTPCSFHPGKKHGTHTFGPETHDAYNLTGEVEQGGAIKPMATDSRSAWTCCRRVVSDDELEAGPARTPGCVNIYHWEIEKVWCCICGRPFTDEDNDVQPDGSSPCSYHPGKCYDLNRSHHDGWTKADRSIEMSRMASAGCMQRTGLDVLSRDNELQGPTMGSYFGPEVTRLQGCLPSNSERGWDKGCWNPKANIVSIDFGATMFSARHFVCTSLIKWLFEIAGCIDVEHKPEWNGFMTQDQIPPCLLHLICM